MSVVVDTNVLVSRLISPAGAPARVFERWLAGSFDLLVSEPILLEYRGVVARPYLRATPREVDAVMAALRERAILVEPAQRLALVPDDPSDDMFLECAVAGGADYIVSGDSHLLALGQLRGIYILRPAAFLTATSV